MNDEFLIQFREAPRAEFAEALYERISRQSQPRFTISILNKLTLRNAGAILAFMLVVAACAYYAVTQTPYRKIGGIWLTVQKTLEIEYIPVEMTSEVIQEQLEVYQCDSSREEAQEVLDFDFLIPTWAPEGFTTDGLMCGVGAISDDVSLSWIGNDGTSYIAIMIHNLRWIEPGFNRISIGPATVWQPVAPGSYKEVQVNGQPAVLIRGDWKQPPMVSEMPTDGKLESEWDENLGLHVYWVNGEELYYLRTNADVSADDLIKMAESAR